VLPLRTLNLEDNPFGPTLPPAADSKAALIASMASSGEAERPLTIGGLPSDIALFDRLEELNINNCGLTDLPAAMSALTNLTALYLYGNQLKEV
jgi:Leucine-rich repeat (LRR) protein